MSFAILSGTLKTNSDLLSVVRIQYEALGILRRYSSEAFVYDDLQPWLDNSSLGMIVAYHGNDVVGSLFHCPFDNKKRREYAAHYRYYFRFSSIPLPEFLEDSWEISYLSVAKEWTRNGVGTALLDRLIADASVSGTSALYSLLWCGGDPVPLFTQKGFRELARLPRLYQNGDDGMIVEKKL